MRRILLFLLFFVSLRVFAQLPTPIGQWLTIDDETNTPRSIVQIWSYDGKLAGKLVKIYFRQGEKDTDVCDKCTDPAHKNQRILGMTMLWGMTEDTDHRWDDGYILDPHNGKIYHCQMALSRNGQELNVRGYIGIPLIGRTQTWTRIDS